MKGLWLVVSLGIIGSAILFGIFLPPDWSAIVDSKPSTPQALDFRLNPQIDPKIACAFPHSLPVTIKSYNPESPDFAVEATEAARPVVFKGTPVNEWPAIQKWSSPYMRTHMPAQLKVHISQLPTVRMHSGVQPLGLVPGIEWLRPYTVANMSSSEFFSTRSVKDGRYPYFFSNVNDLPEQLRHDLGDVSFLTLPWRQIWEVNLWMGPPSLTAPIHYDVLHNFYVQVHGEKRFVMFPPSQAERLYLFPRIHPSTRMSQVDLPFNLSSFPNETFPAFQRAEAVEVLLVPGDVLYIPPYWFHHVTTAGSKPSMSISVHTESDYVMAREILMTAKFPSFVDYTEEDKILALYMYLNTLLSDLLLKIKGPNGYDAASIKSLEDILNVEPKVAAFFQTLWETRFSRLHQDPWVKGLADALEEALPPFEEKLAVLIQHLQDDTEPQEDELSIEEELQEMYDAMTPSAHSLALSLLNRNAMPTHEGSIEVGNFIEDIVCYVLGPLSAGHFLRFMAFDSLDAKAATD